MANEIILIVDADTKSQKVLEVSFKKTGHRVIITESLAEAHEVLRREEPSLIISDTELPDGDGLEFCADLKLSPKTQEIPLIFLTEDRSLNKKMRSFELGADDYLTKPIYIKEVTTRAELLIQRRAKEMMAESEVEEFEGDLRDITMIDLLQTIEKELRSGTVRFHRQGRQGTLHFREGNVLDAACGKVQGEDAVYRLMLWPDGEFAVRYHDNVRRADHIEKDAPTLLMEGIRRFEKWNDLMETLPEVHQIFEADYQRLPDFLGDVPPEVQRLVRLFDGYRRLEEVIDDSPVDDITTLQIIRKLLDDDILLDVTPTEGSQRTKKQAKTLDDWLLEEDPEARAAKEKEKEKESTTDRISKPPVGRFLEDETNEVPRSPGADEKKPPGESEAGGGHWKFHWGEESEGEERAQAQEERAEAEGEDEESVDPLKLLEEQERVRREAEAERLAEQFERLAELSDPSVEMQVAEEDTADVVTWETGGVAWETDGVDGAAAVDGEEWETDEVQRQRQTTPLSSPAIALLDFEDEVAQSVRSEHPTNRIRVPDEIKAERERRAREEAEGLNGPGPSLDDVFDELAEEAAPKNHEEPAMAKTAEVSLEEFSFEQGEEEEEQEDQEEKQSLEGIPASNEAPATQEIAASELFPPFDEDHVEDTEDGVPVRKVKAPLGNVKRNAEDQVLQTAEYELKQRRVSHRVKKDQRAGLPGEDEPTPPPSGPITGEELWIGDEVAGQEPEEVVEEIAAAKVQAKEEVVATPKEEEPQESPSTFDDYEAEYSGGGGKWQVPVLGGLVVVVLLLLVVLVTTRPDGEEEPEAPELQAAVALAEEPEPEEVVEEPEEVVAAEEPGLDRDGAEDRALFEGASVEFEARRLAEEVAAAQPEVVEVVEEPAVAVAEPAAEPTAVVAAAEPEPAPTPEPAGETAEEAAARTVAEDVQRLRSMVQREQFDQALTLARDLSQRAPSNRQAAFLHGRAALNADQNNEAIEQLSRARRLGLSTGDLFIDLATAYQLAGRRDEARGAYESYLEVQPSGPYADEVRSILENQF